MRSVENPSFRLASCVSVDVVNGGAGRSTPGFSSTAVTVQGRCWRSASVKLPRVVLRQDAHVLAGEHAVRVEVLAGRDASVAESRSASPETPGRRPTDALRDPSTPPARNASRSSSRSTINRTATLCTRPALSPVCTFFHSTGDKRVAVQAIENAAALLRPHQILVDVVRVVHGLANGLLGDLVKDDPLDRHLRLENLLQVPADRLALAIRVGRQVAPAWRP